MYFFENISYICYLKFTFYDSWGEKVMYLCTAIHSKRL